MEKELLELFLPEGLLDYFDVVKVDSETSIKVYLDEKNVPPLYEQNDTFTSKGFYEAITIQDFPIRKKACYLIIRRRKWINDRTGNLVNNKWRLAAKGTRMTKELAVFLKGTH